MRAGCHSKEGGWRVGLGPTDARGSGSPHSALLGGGGWFAVFGGFLCFVFVFQFVLSGLVRISSY